MRLAFLGTPDAAVPTLRALVAAGHDVRVVVTRPDRKRGRGSLLVPSPVASCAHELGLRVVHRLADLDPDDVDLGVVVAYGAIVPAPLLERLPMLNVHFSLLPRWRGAAPVERAILAGDRETGVCVMGVEPSLDTGPVYARVAVAIGDRDATYLTNELAERGARLVCDVLARPGGIGEPIPQEGEPTYADKLTAADFAIGPHLGATAFVRTVRLGRAVCVVEGLRVKVLEARVADAAVPVGRVNMVGGRVVAGAADGAVELLRVQPEGRRSMDATAWWSGRRGDASPTFAAPDQVGS